MAKLFLFGIGGTGSRVIKSLTMLLAAGVESNNNQINEIIPVIIDPHKSNKDLARTKKLIQDYESIYKRLGDNRDGFFNTKISKLDGNVIQFELKGVDQIKFKDYINYSTLDDNNKAFASLLFSKETLDVEMDIGFVGNPNIGSIVLNQFTSSDEFQRVASSFSDGDRIFVISSIFGGTGAAGFPLLVKNFRNANQLNIPNKALIAEAPIGAVTVLPYFDVSIDDESPINTSDFIVKTKAALSYYEKNLSGNRVVNAHYYIGDEVNPEYENDPGKNGQKNNAHFIEIAAALSIIDFMNFDKVDLEVIGGKASNPAYFEFGIKQDVQTINFGHLGVETYDILSKPLTKYFMFKQFLEKELKNCIDSKVPFTQSDPKLTNILSSSFYKNYIKDFNKAFSDWLNELEDNKRSFKPFNQDAELDNSIVGIEADRIGVFRKRVSYKYYIDQLNKVSQNASYSSEEEKLISLFNEGLDELLKKYNF